LRHRQQKQPGIRDRGRKEKRKNSMLKIYECIVRFQKTTGFQSDKYQEQ
jgi:hypothetical protein